MGTTLVWLWCAAAGGTSDTEYESYDDDDDERRRETVYVNDAEHWQPISDHDEIRLPQ